jgi:hypothetical protein
MPRSDRPTAPPPPGVPQYGPGEESGTLQIEITVDPGAVPSLAVARDDLAWFDLAPRARELLAYIDGETTIEAICTQASLDAPEALPLFCDLIRDGILTLNG